MTPTQIGRYVVKGELGRGSMGVVYRAADPRLRREVAIKLVLPSGDRARLLRRLSVEAVALGRLRHEAIVTIHEVGEHEGLPYLVMDLVEGRSLQERLDKQGPLAPREAARVARLVAHALAHAHARGVLHRDVKPSNVLLTSDGGAVLTDFGLARDSVASSGVSQAGNMIGTPGYWPPEQARGKTAEVGPASDVYALGATLFAMLTGQPPFVADTFIQAITGACTTPAPAPSSLRPEVDRTLDAITLKALEKEPASRHASADAFAAELERYLQVGDVSDRRRPRAAASAGPLLAAAAGATVSLLVIVGVLALRPTPPEPPPPAVVSVAPVASAPAAAPVVTPAARDAYLRGLVLQIKGRSAEARASFDAALELAPDLAPALQRRAMCRGALGDRPGALADLTRAIEVQGAWDAAPWFHRGCWLGATADDAAAIGDMTKALELAPESIAVAISRALMLVALDRLPEALDGLTALIDRRPDVWTAIYYRGWARGRRAGDPAGGVEDLTRVIALAPRAGGAWRERAYCRLKLDDPGGARADLDRAIDLDSDDADAWDLRAEACGRLGDYAAMERDATQVIRLTPAKASPYSDRSTARVLLRDLPGALADVEEAIKRDSEWNWPLGHRARIRALMGDREGALADFTLAATGAPDDDYHPLWLAGLGQPDPARLEKLATSPSWLAGLARRALGSGTDDDALAFINAADTDSARRERACVILGFLGLFAERDGDAAKARAHYRACLAVRRPMWAQHQWAVNRLKALGPP